MARISKDVHTVIVTIDVADPKEMPHALKLAKDAQPIFAKQKGFVSATLHKSADDKRILNYLQWRTRQDSIDCMQSPDWMSPPSMAFMALIQTGKATMTPMDYAVVDMR